MSILEARAHDAMHQVMDGLDVTDEDIGRMEDDLRAALAGPGRLQGRRGGRRRWRLAVAALVAVVALAAGAVLVTDDSPPARPAGAAPVEARLLPPELVGLWREVPHSPYVWQFTDDDRMGNTPTATGYLTGEIVAMAVTRRVADRYTATNATAACSTEFRIRTTPAGVTVTALGGTCADYESGDEFTLERLSPGVPRAQALVPRFPEGETVVGLPTSLLDGTWFHPESGSVLVIGRGHTGSSLTYVLDDDGDGATDPDHRGVLTVMLDRSIRGRASGTGDTGCAPQFAEVVSNAATMTTTGLDGGCVPAGTRQTWIRLN
ncbi:hypothetical protein [Knoellia sp. Soil729]|uniref:hypothetical protein n=1 Tax=Knoellia sp. Soil729 TaxID=1736394 RepID=UPI0006F1CAB9|nr:hypothetical protein [Knoellia sp. Soil729]KRE40983.1 hypothetical protein ASG74_14005 [Knoellia sp. Soil729]